MDERDQERQPIDARPEGTGRLRAGVATVRGGADRLRGGGGRLREAGGRVRDGGGDAVWFLREKVAWTVVDGLDALGPRGQVGVFGGGGIALAGVVAAILIVGGGSGSGGGTTEAFVTPTPSAPVTKVAPAPKPQKKPAKPSGPTLHGAPPVFAPATGAEAGVGDGTALGGSGKHGGPSGGLKAQRGSGKGSAGEEAVPASGNQAAAGAGADVPASTAKIGSTPAASASAEAQADKLATGSSVGATAGSKQSTEAGEDFSGPPAPKAAKRVARRFAQAFVVYETGGIDAKVRDAFQATSTRQLSRSLLHRPPRQPANVKVPKAKVVTVVAGPSKGQVYEVSVSLLRVGVTSELRLQMEPGPGKKWQVTNVLG
ncbi:MAG: hypothetical protein JSS97_09825 [Actinobacteria bacterium]|nr:hypothetical protein [Actinomycetota bacterium]